jgi:hypothetical protein
VTSNVALKASSADSNLEKVRGQKRMKHPGFKAVQKHIEGEGYSPEQAGAILANKTRNASPAARKANPRLNRVKMSYKRRGE